MSSDSDRPADTDWLPEPTPVPEPVVQDVPGEQLTADTVSSYIDNLLLQYLPCVEGDEHFKEIAKDWGGGGTTCGFLVHWVLWRIRYLNAHVTNRNVPEDGLKYTNGANISRVWCGGKLPFRTLRSDETPEKNDIMFLTNGPPNTEHVSVFRGTEQRKDGLYWLGADGGQPWQNGKQCMRFTARKKVGRTLVTQYGSKGIAGIIPVRSLTFSPGIIMVPTMDGTVCDHSTDTCEGSATFA